MILYIIIVLLMGLVTPIQTAANARLRVCVGYAYVSTLVSFAVSTLALVAVSLLVGTPIVPMEQQMQQVPWWMWLGGIIGATSVFVHSLTIPIIGVGLFSVALLLGQLTLSLGMEHHGLLGAPRKSVSPVQIFGLVLMMLGIVMIRT